MHRRALLATTGSFAAGLAGCLDSGSSGSTETDDDGYPPRSAVSSPTASRQVDTNSFETLSVGGVTVPLIPVTDAHYWFQQRAARFVDARGQGQYEHSHVTGAVLSPARRVEDWSDSREGPTADWPTDGRIVCYCGCPHHLSSLRAGEFVSKGYESVYAIDEGFGGWRDSGYPTTGSEPRQTSYVIRGRTDPADAGGYAWATHRESGQQEAAPVADDGGYELTLRFGALAPTDPVHLRTPSYRLTAPLSRLTEDVVTTPE